MRKHSGGGIAMDHGSHSFYLMFLFMGGFPTAVSAKAFNVDAQKWDTEDNVAAALSFPRGFANVFLTWTAGARKVIYTLQGTEGAITISDDDFELATAKGVEKRVVVSAFNDASHTSWFTSLFDAFRDAIARRDYVSDELREAYMCCHLIERIYHSAEDVPAAELRGRRQLRLRLRKPGARRRAPPSIRPRGLRLRRRRR